MERTEFVGSIPCFVGAGVDRLVALRLALAFVGELAWRLALVGRALGSLDACAVGAFDVRCAFPFDLGFGHHDCCSHLDGFLSSCGCPGIHLGCCGLGSDRPCWGQQSLRALG